MEVEGEAEVSVVEFGEKRMKRRGQTSHRKRKSRKMKTVNIKMF